MSTVSGEEVVLRVNNEAISLAKKMRASRQILYHVGSVGENSCVGDVFGNVLEPELLRIQVYNNLVMSMQKPKSSIVEKALGKGKPDIDLEINILPNRKLHKAASLDIIQADIYDIVMINLSTFALLFSEIVQYSHNRVFTVPELQSKLSDMGQHVGSRLLDVMVVRERGYKREIKLLNMLLFIKIHIWKTLFGKEADKLEHANDDERTYYIIEKEPLVNTFISVPKNLGSLNCSAFTAGIIEAILNGSNFPAKVTVHWHKGTTFMIKFEESVINRDKMVDGK